MITVDILGNMDCLVSVEYMAIAFHWNKISRLLPSLDMENEG